MFKTEEEARDHLLKEHNLLDFYTLMPVLKKLTKDEDLPPPPPPKEEEEPEEEEPEKPGPKQHARAKVTSDT